MEIRKGEKLFIEAIRDGIDFADARIDGNYNIIINKTRDYTVFYSTLHEHYLAYINNPRQPKTYYIKKTIAYIKQIVEGSL